MSISQVTMMPLLAQAANITSETGVQFSLKELLSIVGSILAGAGGLFWVGFRISARINELINELKQTNAHIESLQRAIGEAWTESDMLKWVSRAERINSGRVTFPDPTEVRDPSPGVRSRSD